MRKIYVCPNGIEPLYSVDDAYEAVKRMISLPLHRSLTIAPNVTLRFFDPGHVLGSALVILDLVERGIKKRLLFTGDLGREVRVLGIMRDVRAEVIALEGLSAHADRNDLLEFASAIAKRGELRSLALVHGEREARSALAGALKERLSLAIMEPEPEEQLEL